MTFESVVRWGYLIVRRKAVPRRLRGRLMYPGAFAIFDPDDDSEGWFLSGDDPAELDRLTLENLATHGLGQEAED